MRTIHFLFNGFTAALKHVKLKTSKILVEKLVFAPASKFTQFIFLAKIELAKFEKTCASISLFTKQCTPKIKLTN